MQKLTKEQQQLVQDNMWVVNAVIKEQNLQGEEDLRADAIMYLCKCVIRFNPAFNTKLSTYLYNSLYLYVKRTNAKRKIKNSRLVSEEYLFNLPTPEKDYSAKEIVNKIKRLCNTEEIQILNLKLQGYTANEIILHLNISCGHYKKVWSNIKIKALQIKDPLP